VDRDATLDRNLLTALAHVYRQSLLDRFIGVA